MQRAADSLEVQSVAQMHEWRGGYYCSCGHLLNSAWGYNQHFLTALDDAGVLDVPTPQVESEYVVYVDRDMYDALDDMDVDAAVTALRAAMDR